MSINNTIITSRIEKRIIPYLDKALESNYNIKNLHSFGFIVYFLTQKFDLSVNEAILCVTDGSRDKGIDAVYIDNALGEVNIIQSENKENTNKPAMGENKITNTFKNIFHIMDDEIKMNDVNPFLASKIQDIIYLAKEKNGRIKINIYFITNAKFPSDKTQNSEYNEAVGGNRGYGVYWFELKNILALENETDQKFTTNITVKTKQYSEATDVGNIRGIVATISSSDLIKIYKEGGLDNVFQSNIRNYLGSKPVNRKIRDTAIDKIESKYFWFLNNGISLTCDKYSITDNLPGCKNIEIINPKIINGGQTTKTLVELEAEIRNDLFFETTEEINKLFKGVELLIRIYETNDKALVNKITVGTNTQNAISKQDLTSNNKYSKLVQSYFEDNKFGLEIKKNEYTTPLGEKKCEEKKLIYIALQDEILQFYVSIYKEKPSNAYISKTKIFVDFYDIIFSEKNTRLEYLPKEFFRAFEISYFVQNQIKNENIANGNSFLSNGSIFLMYIISQISPEIKDIDKSFQEFDLLQLYLEAKRITKILVEIRRKREQDLYSNNKYFKTEECKNDFLIWKRTN